MNDYPAMIATLNHIEPVPRRIRATIGSRTVLDTTRAIYLWEWPNYPQYYIPLADIQPDVLVDENHEQRLSRGTARRFSLRAGDVVRPGAARVCGEDALPGLDGFVRFEWDSLDSWFEEDEQVFVHPRNPYTRVDVIRSTRAVRVELDGVVLAESSSTVMVFETGLPTRYYFNRTEVNFDALAPTDTESSCPYKGDTSGYWSIKTPVGEYPDLAWAYDFPTRQLQPITGLISFYNEKVDLFVDDQPIERAVTHFFK
jgi:uncharacterized protein (DUF427 family)